MRKVLSEYFGISRPDASAPIQFPVILKGGDAVGLLEGWLDEVRVLECVQYRLRSSGPLRGGGFFRLYECHRCRMAALIAQERVKEARGETNAVQKPRRTKECGCNHRIRAVLTSDDVTITSECAMHSGHIPGTLDDIRLLSMADSTRALIVKLYSEGLQPRDIQRRVEAQVLENVPLDQPNYNLRITFLKNHGALCPRLRVVQNYVQKLKALQGVDPSLVGKEHLLLAEANKPDVSMQDEFELPPDCLMTLGDSWLAGEVSGC